MENSIDLMKNTALTDKHIALGAKMVPFAGYNMPISYTSINEEHNTVRRNAGVFDVSHMGEFILKGEEIPEKKWLRKKRKLILCFLFLSAGKVLSKDKVVDIFFGNFIFTYF